MVESVNESGISSLEFVLSFGVPREVVPLWVGASNHKREMLVFLCFVLYVYFHFDLGDLSQK
jgi:hypothetical protein